ncbi:MAG: PqqD family protein [Myxococcota bacterium]
MCFKQAKNVAVRAFDDALFLVDPEHAQLHELNEVGGRIWSLCDGQHSPQEMVHKVFEEFDVSREQAQIDIDMFLQRLVGKALVIPCARQPKQSQL